MADSVNHPNHYNTGGIEVIDAIEAWDFGEGFNRGNAIKYIVRAGRKDKSTEIEDLEKAGWYIQREIARMKQLRDVAKEQRTCYGCDLAHYNDHWGMTMCYREGACPRGMEKNGGEKG